MKAKTSLLMKYRNPLHDHPLLHKGAPHGKTTKAKRRAEKIQLRREYPTRSAFAA